MPRQCVSTHSLSHAFVATTGEGTRRRGQPRPGGRTSQTLGESHLNHSLALSEPLPSRADPCRTLAVLTYDAPPPPPPRTAASWPAATSRRSTGRRLRASVSSGPLRGDPVRTAAVRFAFTLRLFPHGGSAQPCSAAASTRPLFRNFVWSPLLSSPPFYRLHKTTSHKQNARAPLRALCTSSSAASVSAAPWKPGGAGPGIGGDPPPLPLGAAGLSLALVGPQGIAQPPVRHSKLLDMAHTLAKNDLVREARGNAIPTPG